MASHDVKTTKSVSTKVTLCMYFGPNENRDCDIFKINRCFYQRPIKTSFKCSYEFLLFVPNTVIKIVYTVLNLFPKQVAFTTFTKNVIYMTEFFPALGTIFKIV